MNDSDAGNYLFKDTERAKGTEKRETVAHTDECFYAEFFISSFR